MAASFFVMSKKKNGYATLFVRLQCSHQKIDYKCKTPMEVNWSAWKNSRKSFTAQENFRKGNPALTQTMDMLKKELEATQTLPKGISLAQFKAIINDVLYREAHSLEMTQLMLQQRPSLNDYIATYIQQVVSGVRQTEQGRNYAHMTVKAIKQAMRQFELSQEVSNKILDYEDIDMSFYYDYTAWLKSKGYAINSIGKCIKILKSILAASQSEGIHSSSLWKDKKFKVTHAESDSIYLTKEDLFKIMTVDLTGLPKEYEYTRDIFMVGVGTAQRVSDYNNIKPEDINTMTKTVSHDAADPDHPGQVITKFHQQEITYINIRQQKTGTKVSIPCNSFLKGILDKYHNRLPHLPDQTINRCIKEIACMAGLKDLLEIEINNGGVPHKVMMEKYKMVHSHTARRTGATLMYLEGIDLYDIMKVTGHSSPTMLKKYIKAENLKVVEKLYDKYEFFK